MSRINPLLAATLAPPIPEVSGWRNDYDGQSGPLIDLSQAVPSRPPPDELMQALAAAAGEPDAARYGDVPGDAALRQRLAVRINQIYGSQVGPQHLLITSGCNQAFFEVIIALAQTGETVALPEPYYFNHRMTLDMLGIHTHPIQCEAENRFLPDPDAVEAALATGAVAVALVSPNNPTGAVYPATLLDDLLARCQHYGAALIIDETYRDFMPDSQDRPHDLLARDDFPAGLVQLYSFSKAYCIPGYRLGAVAGSPGLIDQITKVHDSLQICAPRVAQIALARVMDSLGDFCAEQRALVNQRANRFRQLLDELPEWKLDSIGAFFAFVRHRDCAESTRVARTLAREAGILCLPGDFFSTGPSPHLRFAFANVGIPEIEEVARRLAKAGASLNA